MRASSPSSASQLFKEHSHFIAEDAFASVTMEPWEQVRIRLVQLMYLSDFAQIYYITTQSQLVSLERCREAFGTDEEQRWEQTVRDHLEVVEPEEEWAAEAIHRYVPFYGNCPIHPSTGE